MDLGLTEPQEMLKKMARDFLTTECPKKLVRDMEEDEKGFSEQLWSSMAELGWQGLPFPEEVGGGGGSFLDLAVLLEEMGRACLPSPFFPTVVLAGLALLDAGTDEQKKNFLPQIAEGKAIISVALTEPAGGYQASNITMSATRDQGDFVLNGTKLFVQDAHVSDWMLVAARTSGEGEEGITLFLVDSKSPGVSISTMASLAKDKQCEVVFKDVRVPTANVLGEVDKGWKVVAGMLRRAAIAKSVEMVGGAQQVLEMTVDYAKERVQFDKPIGTFQAIQHHCSNMALDVDSTRLLVYQAAWKMDEGMPCDLDASFAKAWASDAYKRVCTLGHQVHGAIGFTLDHDMQLYSRRCKVAESAYGDSDFHREAIASLLEA